MLIAKDEATAARRRVPFRLFTSDGTSPDTGASNDSVILAVNSSGTIVPNVLVQAVESAQGMYYVELSQSNVSVLGVHALYHQQGDFSQHVANLEVVQHAPYSAISQFDFSTDTVILGSSNITVNANTVQIEGVDATDQINAACDTALTDYDAVVPGDLPTNFADLSITATTGRVDVASIEGTDATNQLESSVAASTVTVGMIQTGVVDANALATDAGQEIADRVLARNVAGGSDTGRTLAEAFAALRNRVEISNVSLIVYDTDDTTVLWHASITTTGDSIFLTDANPT